jgi:NitT/TauT family transport system substrate-binding protein
VQEAQGYRKLFDVRVAEAELGLQQPLAMIGYVFSDDFAAGHRDAIERFLAMTGRADQIMLQSDAEWDQLRPLMDAEDQATFESYRETVRQTIPVRPIDVEEAEARILFTRLAEIGGIDLTGPSKELDAGLYFHPTSSGEN